MQNKILVDSSVLIDMLNDKQTKHTALLGNAVKNGYGWAISAYTYREVLQGVRSEREFSFIKTYLDEQEILFLPNNYQVHAVGAKHYRLLRQNGITIRNAIDLLIAQTAIEYGLLLLHNDRDFDYMAQYITDLQILTEL